MGTAGASELLYVRGGHEISVSKEVDRSIKTTCTWEEPSVGFMLTSIGSFFTSTADLMVLVFWEGKNNIYELMYSKHSKEESEKDKQVPARLPVYPAAV